MAWYSKIASWFKKAASKVSAFLIAVLGSEAAHQLGDAAIAALKTALGVIVQDAVIAVSGLQIGSEAKRAEAFKKIVTDAKAAGLTISTSLINLLIELAVQRIKDNIVPLTEV
jgi:hypothetical protein